MRFGANGYLTLQARATGEPERLDAAPARRADADDHRASCAASRAAACRSLVQGRAAGSRRYDTFADTTTSSNGRFRVRYRFRNAASRGRSFVFRARIRTAPRFPYETGYSKTVTVRVR